MSDQNFSERFDNPAFPEKNTNLPMDENLDPALENRPILANLVAQTPLGVPAPVAGPLADTQVNKMPVYGAAATVEPITGDFGSSTPQSALSSYPLPNVDNVETHTMLLDHDQTERLRARWGEIQGKFVDEPRTAVEQADKLVSEVIETISRMFTTEQGSLENQWKQGNDVSTEDLRKALQHYRTFFNRLVV